MKIVFRTDASHKIGTGHVTRCLTLANALRDRGATCYFVCRSLEGNLIKRIQQQNFVVFSLPIGSAVNTSRETDENLAVHTHWLGTRWQVDAEQTISALGDMRPDWLIVDHYALDARWERVLRPRSVRIFVIDDLADRDHDCDLLLNQNLIADMTHLYNGRVPAHCGCLLGTGFALLQSQYTDLRQWALPRIGPIRRIFVFVGGTDHHNLTGRAIAAALALERSDIEIDVVINPASPHAADVQEQIRTHPAIKLHGTLPSLAPLILEADLAIGAGGATSWERCCLGLPSIVITTAENQIPTAMELNRQGYIRWLGHQDTVSESTLKNALQSVLEDEYLSDWSERCMTLVDGLGTDRIATVLSLGSATELVARFARLEDEALLLQWANDPLVRQRAFNPNPIDSQSHQDWFYRRLHNQEKCKIYIVETLTGMPIGQVRFEKEGQDWEIHYALNSLARNRGLGLPMLKTAISEFSKNGTGERLFAQVKIDNIASQRIFKKMGFKEVKSSLGLTYLISSEGIRDGNSN